MKISRPILFFDLETTGLDIQKDRIVQIATIKLLMDGSTEEKKYLFNPQILISPEASAVHGITDEMVQGAPFFTQYAKSLADYMHGCDIAGFNSDYFDFPLLIKEFNRCGIVDFPNWDFNLVDVLKYEKLLKPNNLSEVYKRYTGKTLEGAHDALNDVRATLEILMHQTDGNEDITPEDIDLLCQGERKRFDLNGKLYINKEGVVCWAIGKNAHKSVFADMPYLDWVLKSDFPEETKQKIKSLLNTNN
jgi:DNA polymerase III subunit epsilon